MRITVDRYHREGPHPATTLHRRFAAVSALALSCVVLLCLCLSGLPAAHAEVVRMEVSERRSFAEGKPFGAAGPYEIIEGRLHFAFDPDAPVNQRIADLEFAPRNSDGKAEFSSDFFLMKPINPALGNRRILYDVDNRGNKLSLWSFNEGERTNAPHSEAHAGNGFLLRHGYSLLWVGWNSDVVDDGNNRLEITLPVARHDDGTPIRGQVHLEISVDNPERSWTFGWSPWGVAAAYPSVDINDSEARVTKRPTRDAPGVEIPRDAWQFARWEDGEIIPDPSSIYVEEGLEPGWLYDVVYTAENPRVMGLGMAAIRDAVSFFRYQETDAGGTPNPLAGAVSHAYLFGISQSGRLVNHFVYDGFNTSADQRPVFDGAIAHVAGAGRGLFNHRFGLATLYGTQHRDNLVPSETFPMATVPSVEPVTGETGDMLARAREQDHVPKLFFVQSSTEYWSRGASLLHTDVTGETDLLVDDDVRIYLIAGSQHLGATPATPGIGQTPRNPLYHRPPIFRALLVALDRWVTEGTEPPESRYPRIDDGTLVPLETFAVAFPSIPGTEAPRVVYEPLRLDFGPRWRSDGVATIVPPDIGPPYRTLVPMVDEDGNELAGIRLPDIAAPVGTYTGWSLRAAEHGAEGMLAGLDGSYLEFPRTAKEREIAGDSRRSIHERYSNRADYLSRIAEAAMGLEEDGFLLAEDAIEMIRRAAERDYW